MAYESSLVAKKNRVRVTVKMCTVIYLFALASGGLRPPDPLAREFALARPPPHEPVHCKILATLTFRTAHFAALELHAY